MNRVSVIARVMYIVCLWAIACSPTTLPVAQGTIIANPQAQQATSTIHQENAPRPDCSGDTEPITVAPGWKLVWQRVFDHPIARPPTIDGSQVFLLEAANPILPDVNFRDALWALTPETGATQWRFGDASNPSPLHIRDSVEISQKYLALLVVRSASPSEDSIVIDRLSGQVILDNKLTATQFTISDEALYYSDSLHQLNRLDLPSGEHRWARRDIPRWTVFALNSDLFVIDQPRIYQLDPLSGNVIATTTLGLAETNLTEPPQPVEANTTRMLLYSQGIALFDFRNFATRWAISGSFRKIAIANSSTPASKTWYSSYIFDERYALIRLDLPSGQIIWTTPSLGLEAASSPRAAGGLVYALFADGTLRAFSEADGSQAGIVARVPLWYWPDHPGGEWRELISGLEVAGDIVIVTTGCRSVYAIQREN